MTAKIEKLSITGFRSLRELTIEKLGNVNLLTGKNNSGKSSLLEAIRILATSGNARILYNILDYREESSQGEVDKPFSLKDVAPICSFFSGFPNLSSCGAGFTIEAEGELPSALRKFSVTVNWFVRSLDPERQTVTFELASSDLFADSESFPALDLESGGRKRVVPLDRIQRRASLRAEQENSPVPCVYLDPFSSRSTTQLAALWDAIALTDVEHEVVSALKVISSDIIAVSMVGGGDYNPRGRTAIARTEASPVPIPLRSFGDGVNRLFGIILSLCNAKGGFLLVDEIENGLHYSVQAEIWKIIFRLSKVLDVQVFATSHSWDCVRAFQIAAAESPWSGVLTRLSRSGESIRATTFSEDELAIVSQEQIEVR